VDTPSCHLVLNCERGVHERCIVLEVQPHGREGERWHGVVGPVSDGGGARGVRGGRLLADGLHPRAGQLYVRPARVALSPASIFWGGMLA
jgi:hypothetical protein